MLSEPDAHELLWRLCVDLGFCLPPTDRERLKQHPPSNAAAFTDELFRAEGLDPELADLTLYRQVKRIVSAAYRKSEARGA